MTWTPRAITDTEQALLQLLWRHGQSTVRDLADRLYPGGTHSQYATVQSLLDRLERKGCVSRRKEGRVNVYKARVTRAEVIRRRLRETADALCDGSLAPLLSHLVELSDPTPEEADALERLVDRLAAGGDSRRR